MKIKSYFLFLTILISSCAHKVTSLSGARKDVLYRFELPGTMLVKTVLLRGDGSFEYRSLDDLVTFFAFGKWKQIGDTLVLSNEIDKSNIPIEIAAKPASRQDTLTINLVTDNAGNILKNAVVFCNGDPVKSCMPAFDECRFFNRTISSIKVNFGYAESGWVKVDPISSGEVTVKFPLNIDFHNYIFDRDFRFAVAKNAIWEICKDSAGGETLKFEFKRQ